MTPDRPHVLVVEDEPELADIFDIWLSEEFVVDTVTKGEDALDLLDVDLDGVILDWRMPDVSGEDVLAAMEETGIDCPVAVITGADPEVIGVDDQVDLVLRKPVRSDELIDAVQELTGT